MNRLNMQKDENDVIRYLMKEMDPSEEVLMERAMMEDDDLLIEVESMRQTLQRLDDMPEKEPPAELTASIVQQAADRKTNTSYWPSVSVPSEFYKYAAVLLIGMGLGSGIWFVAGNTSSNQRINGASALSASAKSASSVQDEIQPWIDRDDVLYFQDEFSRNAGQPDGYNAILETSMKKLTPVTDQSLQPTPNSRTVHLTGAHN